MNESQPTRSTKSLVVGLVIAIAVCFLAAAIGGVATTSSVNGWYAQINKPSWNPPDWIFGPVWTILYLMMGASAWLVWKQSDFSKARLALGFFAIQLALNITWSVLFFGLRQPGWAFVEIIALWVSIALTIVLFYKHSKLAAGLLVPYLLWVTFAAGLNFAIWSLNRIV
jgi:tryptophan-rich sensory protein